MGRAVDSAKQSEALENPECNAMKWNAQTCLKAVERRKNTELKIVQFKQEVQKHISYFHFIYTGILCGWNILHPKHVICDKTEFSSKQRKYVKRFVYTVYKIPI